MALVVLLCGVSGVAQAYDADKLCTSEGKHVIAFTPYEGMRLDGKLLPPWVAADMDCFGFILVWKGRVFRDNYCPVDAAEPAHDRYPGVFMRDAMLNAPPETPFGTAMGAFAPAERSYPQNGTKFCSDDFDNPANLVFGDVTGEMVWIESGDKPTAYIPASVTLTVGEKIERFTIHKPLTGDDGSVFGAAVELPDLISLSYGMSIP